MSELVDCINNLSAEDIIRSVAKTANGVPFYLQTTGLSGFCAEYQTVYDALTTKPSAAIADAQNTFFCGLVDEGIYAEADIMYMIAQTVNSGNEALVNWINPGTWDGTIVLNGGALTFTALEGLKSDGLAYVDTGWNPATAGGNFTQNDNCFGGYSRAFDDTGWALGNYDATRFNLFTWVNGAIGTRNYNNSAGNSNDFSGGTFVGMKMSDRKASNQLRSYENGGVPVLSAVVPSGAIPNFNFFLLALNASGTPNSITDNVQLSLFIAGGALSNVQHASLFILFETYMDSNGKGVVL